MDLGLTLTVIMILSLIGLLMTGFPVAFTLGGVSLLFGLFGIATGALDSGFIEILPNRVFSNVIQNELLFAVPLFISMGVILEKSKIAEDLLESMGRLFGSIRGGLGISVTIVGALLAASTGIVGATVVTMGLMSLPTMLKRGYDTRLATGSIAAAGTLGQIIPPSIVLILLADVMSNAWQQAQTNMGIFSPSPLSAGQLFAGALLPGLLLVGLYIAYQVFIAISKPTYSPALEETFDFSKKEILTLLGALFPPLLLIIAVLGSILNGIATPTEAAAVGAVGAMLLSAFRVRGKAFWATYKSIIHESMLSTIRVSSMIYTILIGAALFSLVFRGFGGDEAIEHFLSTLPGGYWTAILLVMLVMFVLGFFLDFIEITFVVVPIVAPALLAMDGSLGPIWLGILIAMNLQTSFLTPPFGFALFYLRGVAPDEVATSDIYKGALPFVAIQIIALLTLAVWPTLATWLPSVIF
ncbi:TRAP transporter large permease subunit [Temperatibacter marinus]|uniref:TRAP transporter large permease protein n=1 Tax=Temperatibacter marinus TaxID=1456591 RepID=A0AA52EGU2_9PROT|nr:TRAP transporter large permease subunit [Temperatibacter marinus]WND02530.1 TRAP transporter large permease subunit [Temperatibacter marinus]